MRRLLLLRHAKAAIATGHDDFERALIERGRRDATRIGGYMARAGLVPALIYHSGARRARETAELVRAAWPDFVEARVEPRLYEAARATVETIVRGLPDAAASVMIVGHNPSLIDVANRLAGRGDRGDLLRLSSKFPTGGLVALDFDVRRWREIEPAEATLACFVTPDDPKVERT